VRHHFIEAERATYPVTMLCRVVQVSRSGFYTWQRRPPSARVLETRQLDVAIKAVFVASRQRSGSPKVAQALRTQGWQVSDSRMRYLGLRSITRRRFRVTTDSKHPYSVAPNRLQRNFTAQRPNQVWVSDLTYLRVGPGWLYLAVFIDLHSRRVVGWALSSRLDHIVVLIALRRAVTRRRFVQSMSRKGDCWDNAVAESFFHLLKSELAHHCQWPDYTVAHRDLFEYIEIFFNRERSHSTLHYMTPDQFEKKTLSKFAA
jgi:putative transposase